MTLRIIAVWGAEGQVGREAMLAAWPEGLRPVALPRPQADVTSPAAVARAFKELHPAFVLNCAAYTQVDRAENEADLAFAVNRNGAAHLADACAASGIPLLHLSSDYVFDGSKADAYDEDAPIAPQGVYARSKAEGEAEIRRRLTRYCILRTAWVFSAHGTNFVKTILRLGAEREELRVVADQHGCPTAAADIAAACVGIITRWAEGGTPTGTYHFAGMPPTTWHGLAEATIDLAAPVWGRRPGVVPIRAADYPTPVKRPANSVLDISRINRDFGLAAPDWRKALAETVATLLCR
jgi:dTDP-4-dehydrorhamnose reductase